MHGTFDGENLFTQSGGTETGNPVVQHAGTFVDSAGTGSFIAYQATIEGTIPAGQTVTNLASPGNSNDTIGAASAGVTVDGTLTCQTTSNTICSFSTPNDSWPGIIVASGGTLSTTGPGIPSHDVFANLSTNIDVKAGGTLTIANPATRFNANTLTNAGNWQVTAVGYLDIGGNSVVKHNRHDRRHRRQRGDPARWDDLQSAALASPPPAPWRSTPSAARPKPRSSPTPTGLAATFSHFSFGRHHYKVTNVKNTSGEITNVEVKPVKS